MGSAFCWRRGRKFLLLRIRRTKKNGGEGLPFWVNPYKEAESFLFSKNKTKYQGEFYGITYFIEDGF